MTASGGIYQHTMMNDDNDNDWQAGKSVGCVPINLGTGNGVSVLELVEAMRKASGKPIPLKVR